MGTNNIEGMSKSLLLVRRVGCRLASGSIATPSRACTSVTSAPDVDNRRTVQPILGNYPITSVDSYVAPSASVIGQVEVYDKVGIWYNAVVRGDQGTITIGAFSHVMDGAVILSDKTPQPGFEASTYIASNVHIGSRAFIKGCTVMDNAMIGNGAVVLEGALIEEGAVVEAGSVVPAGARVPTKEVWGGNPLKFVRKLDYKELDNPIYAGRELWDLAQHHKQEQLPAGQAYVQAENAGL